MKWAEIDKDKKRKEIEELKSWIGIEHGGKPETKEERLEKIKKQVVAQQAKLEAGQHLHVRGL